MKKIGQGWQYTTYDLNNGRVLKKFHSWPKAYFVILREIFPFKEDSFFDIPTFIKDVRKRENDSLELLKRKNIPQEWMANPRFVSKYNFEQDKVIPLHDVFKNSNTEEGKRVVDLFIEFNLKLLNFGVMDKGFNVTKNYGLNNSGEIVLIDIGELFDDEEYIKNKLRIRGWEKSYIGGCIEDREVREYFISEMDRNFHKK